MTKIAFIVPSPTSGHAVRGIGFYTTNILPHLKEIAAKSDIQVEEITDSSFNPSNYSLIHYPYLDLFSQTLPQKKFTKTVVTIHDVIPLEYPTVYQLGLKAKINFYLQKLALKNVDRIITDSLASAQSIHSHLDISQEKIKVIYLAAHDRFKPITNQKFLKDIKKKYALPDKFVLYVGDMNYSKNINFLMETCIALNLPLCIGGKSITQLASLDLSHPELYHLQKTKNYLTNPLIKLLGFIPDEDIIAVYNLATIYCQPSYAEGFGLPMLEAMSSGTPVLASRASSLTEIVGPQFDTYQFDPTNSKEFSTLLEKVWTNPSLRKQNATMGLKRSKDFSWQKTAEQTLLTYKELL